MGMKDLGSEKLDFYLGGFNFFHRATWLEQIDDTLGARYFFSSPQKGPSHPLLPKTQSSVFKGESNRQVSPFSLRRAFLPPLPWGPISRSEDHESHM